MGSIVGTNVGAKSRMPNQLLTKQHASYPAFAVFLAQATEFAQTLLDVDDTNPRLTSWQK
jgi:hypothetical protein